MRCSSHSFVKFQDGTPNPSSTWRTLVSYLNHEELGTRICTNIKSKLWIRKTLDGHAVCFKEYRRVGEDEELIYASKGNFIQKHPRFSLSVPTHVDETYSLNRFLLRPIRGLVCNFKKSRSFSAQKGDVLSFFINVTENILGCGDLGLAKIYQLVGSFVQKKTFLQLLSVLK